MKNGDLKAYKLQGEKIKGSMNLRGSQVGAITVISITILTGSIAMQRDGTAIAGVVRGGIAIAGAQGRLAHPRALVSRGRIIYRHLGRSIEIPLLGALLLPTLTNPFYNPLPPAFKNQKEENETINELILPSLRFGSAAGPNELNS